MKRPLVIHDFATSPFWISLEENFILFFISVLTRARYTNLSLSAPILKEGLHLVEAVGLLLEVLEEAEQLLRHSQAGIIALSLAILLRGLAPVKRFEKMSIHFEREEAILLKKYIYIF
jgi:hypothetical protein